jgi:hypothetical protein
VRSDRSADRVAGADAHHRLVRELEQMIQLRLECSELQAGALGVVRVLLGLQERGNQLLVDAVEPGVQSGPELQLGLDDVLLQPQQLSSILAGLAMQLRDVDRHVERRFDRWIARFAHGRHGDASDALAASARGDPGPGAVAGAMRFMLPPRSGRVGVAGPAKVPRHRVRRPTRGSTPAEPEPS